MIRISQIRDGKWLADAGFSGTNLGNPDLIMSNLVLFCKFVPKKGRREAQNIILWVRCVLMIKQINSSLVLCCTVASMGLILGINTMSYLISLSFRSYYTVESL